MESMNRKRRRLEEDNNSNSNGARRGFKFSILSRCDKFAPMSSLPHEVLREEVLSRLPIRDLCRAKCVCKQWRSIITSPDFIHHDDEPSHGLVIATAGSDEFLFYYSPLSEQHHRQRPRGFIPRLRVPRGRDSYQWTTGVVNGLVCLYSATRLSLFSVCTGEARDLPLPPPPTPEIFSAPLVDSWSPEINDVEKCSWGRFPGAEDATNCTITRYCLGFDTLRKAYKVLSLSIMCREGCPGPVGDVPCGCPLFMVPQVLTVSSSSSCSWRKVPQPIPFFYPPEMQTLSANGLLLWIGIENAHICFDLTAKHEHFRPILHSYPPVSDSQCFFHYGSILSQYGGDFAVSDCVVQQRSLRLFTHSAQDIYSEWNKCDIHLPVELLRRGKSSSITLVGNLPDGDILIANDKADDSLTPVYSFTPGRNKRFSKSFKVGKFPQATASMSRRELAAAVSCVQDNLTPLSHLIGNHSHL